MSELSEEDIIDIAERIANFGWSDYDDFETNKKAIQGILDLYQKEKEKNKSIEAQRLRDMCYKTDGNYVSKDKIKEKIEELKKKGNYRDIYNPTGRVHFMKEETDYQIEILKELLGE